MPKSNWLPLDECDDLDQLRKVRLFTNRLWFLSKDVSDYIYDYVEESILDLMCPGCELEHVSCNCYDNRDTDIYDDGAEFE